MHQSAQELDPPLICWIEENNDDLTTKSTSPPRDVSLSLRKILNSFDGKISLSKMLFVSHVSVINATSVFLAIKKFCVQFMFEKTSSFALCMLVRLLALITAQFTVEQESLSVDCRFIVEFSGFRIAVSIIKVLDYFQHRSKKKLVRQL
jgi:hypothetical protein